MRKHPAAQEEGRQILAKGLSRQRLIVEALQLVDESGLEALSMRRLAGRVGVDPMAAYRHLPNKEALLDGLVEEVVRGIDLEVPPGAWEERLREGYRRLWRGLHAHPNALPLLNGRPWVTGTSLDVVEAGMNLLEDSGVPTREAVIIANTTTLFLVSLATAAAGRTPEVAEQATRLLAGVDHASHPRLANAVEGGHLASYADMFDWWLDRTIEQVAAIRSHGRGAPAHGIPSR